MEAKGVGKYGINVWGWPSLWLYIFGEILFLVTEVILTDESQSVYELEDGSGADILVTAILAIFFICYLGILVYRYCRLSAKKITRLEIGIITIIALFYFSGIIYYLVSYLV